MLTDLLLVAAPFALGILLVAMGADITDPAIAEELEREKKNNAH